ncbi:MAG: elongation factor EF-2 [Halobacteriales archaeon]|nr:elongation factor EF-2 [Halobacteriales archaeon]
MGRRKKIVQECERLMDNPENIRNIAIAAHIDHGKTTLTDNLLAGAGMISKDLAGQQLAMDTEEDEQERGITIDAANVSMTHEWNDTNHLINLIDTPGHVDFGGDVTRAMRAVDGALVVVDAVEGTMPQTETVLRQALREDVKPALFVNKVDRLINELREGPEEMQERLQQVIHEVNELIKGIAPERYEEDNWKVSVQDGTVAFGSALYNWAVSLPSMQETGIDFADIIDYNLEENVDELKERSPLADVVLDMVAKHFPNPVEAQPRRIPHVWRGDEESEIAIQMRDVDDEGEVVLMVTDISLDPHAGEIATGRLFSGTIERGQDLYVSGTAGQNRIQSVGIFMGGEREEVEHVPAGNIAAVTGLKDAIAGSTVSSAEMTAFESIDHISEPVITKSIEAQSMDDLPKLIEVLQQVSKEDPTLKVEINEDTGEHLISGQGELHLEVQTQRIERNQGIPVRTGEPIVVYREAAQGVSDEVEGVSPNRHNRFYMRVQPMPEELVAAIKMGELSMDMPELERREVLQEHGIDKDTSQNLEEVFGTNLVFDDTKGIQHLNETMELVVEGFEEALDEGPLAAEPVQGLMIHLLDARLHEDAIHRGPAQVIPAVREALHRALVDAEVRLLEPVQDVRIDVPSEFMGPASSEIQGRRGRVDDMFQEGDRMVIEGVAPVEEMIGFSSDIRSATEGRASWNTENAGFEVLADNLHPEIISEIRERKGMKQELPAGVDYL